MLTCYAFERLLLPHKADYTINIEICQDKSKKKFYKKRYTCNIPQNVVYCLQKGGGFVFDKLRYTIVDSAEFTYPDRWEYPTASNTVSLHTPRGTYASFQILLGGLCEEYRVKNWLPESIYHDPALKKEADIGFPRMGGVSIANNLPFDIEWYALVPVTIEQNYNLPEEYRKPHHPERIAPYRVYDCLRPFDGSLDVGVADGRENDTDIGGLYGAICIPKDATPGDYTASITVSIGNDRVCIPVELKIYPAVIPAETLTIIQGYHPGKVTQYHAVENGSNAFYALDAQYVKALRRMRQNMMYVGGVKVTEVAKNQYTFDFSTMEETMRRHLALGVTYFCGPSVGWRESWSTSTILLNGNIPAMSYEGYCYLSQYLSALHEMLERNGWLDRFVMGVSDEPNEYNATEFRALCGMVRKLVPDIPLMDATSYANIHGSLDIYVPLNSRYDRETEAVESLRSGGEQLWHYVCCAPRSKGYINRFIDFSLLATRYLLWGNYKYNLSGYLHWSTNCYQTGQDPFRLSCPGHKNTDRESILPPGDTHILYPGKDAPWLSIRAEAQREGAEEYEMLKALAAVNKEKADEICNKLFHSFKDVEYDVKTFRTVKNELLAEFSKTEG